MSVVGIAKTGLRALLGSRHLARLFDWMLFGRVTVFMMHRFADLELGTPGHDPDQLRANLTYLRHAGYQTLSLSQLLAQGATQLPERGVVFTVDDGYADFARIAAPVFAEFDCPVTVFLTTGFLDGELWPWWDRLEFALDHTRHRRLQLETARDTWTLEWDGPGSRLAIFERLAEGLKQMPNEEKLEVLDRIAIELDVEVPGAPPRAFLPLCWNDVRTLERSGVGFGPHSVTHPILSRTGDQQASWEMQASWQRVRDEVVEPVPVFCYPNGDPASFSEREMRIARDMGLRGAVSSIPRYVEQRDARDGRYALPRFGYPGDPHTFVRLVSGIERLRSALR